MGVPVKSLVVAILTIIIVLAIITIALINWPSNKETKETCPSAPYNYTYPRSPPIPTPDGAKYRIAVISDLDKASKIYGNDTAVSYFKKGYLTYNGVKKVSLVWDGGVDLFSMNVPPKTRGAEFSELVTFNGKLLTIDDKTGLLYEIDDVNKTVHNWTFLADGDGKSSQGLKGEWATIKDGLLYVGSNGRDDLKEGHVVGHNKKWIKTISMTGEVKHFDWSENYDRMRNVTGSSSPGYLIHEACVWSAVHQRWFFLPRKLSKEAFSNETVDEKTKGTNILLSSNADFSNITVTHVGSVEPTHGFSSFKFIPGSNDTEIVALKSKEVGNVTASYVMAFTISGEVLLKETEIANVKYEGIEFI